MIDSGSAVVGQVEVTDKKDGTYQVDYRHTVKGIYTFEAVTNGDTANKKTSTLTMIADTPDPSKSTLANPATVTLGVEASMDVVAKDQYSNLITASVQEIAYHIVGKHGDLTGGVPVKTQAAGLYQLNYTVPVHADATSTTCGSV